MPGRAFLTTGGREVADWLGWDGAAPEIAPRRNIAPGQEVLALTPEGLGLARWGMIPVGRINARKRPVMETIVNARSETVFDKTAFAGTGRAVVPFDGWYEWTGAPRRKSAWRIRRFDGGLLGFAAIWDVWTAPGGRRIAQVATVTCPPSADVAAVHDRMGVILSRDDVAVWMGADTAAAAALMRPLAAGSLLVEAATDVDWSSA